MSEQKTQREIAAEIVTAMLPQIYGTSDDRKIGKLAEDVAKAFRTIYAAVQSPSSD